MKRYSALEFVGVFLEIDAPEEHERGLEVVYVDQVLSPFCCLDSKMNEYRVIDVRTTVTSESDVERLIREKMHRSRKSFKKTLNDAVRKGLLPETNQSQSTRFVVKARSMGVAPGIDPATLSDLDTDLEVERFNTVTQQVLQQKT